MNQRSLQWRRVLIESVAVVLSILLAFSIDAWWDGHRDRVRERELLRGILADFQASRPNLVERLELSRRMATNTTLFVDLVSGADGELISVADSLVLAVIGGPTYEPATTTLDAALSSGEIELIRSDTIRAELADWRRALIDTTEDEVEVRRITNEQLVPVLGGIVDLGPYYAQVLDWSVAAPVADLPGETAVRASSELASVLALRQFYSQFAADDLDGLLASLDRMVEILRTEMGADSPS